ncbi:MAG: bacillithiol biosynthesis cysteine-adding enzyme BshC [Longimicrobiales bacterium]
MIDGIEFVIRWPEGPPLLRTYLHSWDSLAAFFAADPWRIEGYRRQATAVRSRFDIGARSKLRDYVRPAGEAGRQRVASALAEGVLVTTGQQPALFGGPLYNVYKIATTIALADRLQAELDVPTAPVFWIGSDDHDWAEANHTHLLTPDNQLCRIALPPERDAQAPPLSLRILDGAIETALDDFAQVIPETEFKGPLLRRLRAAYRPGVGFGAAFGSLVADWFADTGLALVDAADPALKKASAGLLASEAAATSRTEQALVERTDQLERAGFEPRLAVLPGATNLFYHGATGRQRIAHSAGRFHAGGAGRSWEESELIAEIGANPERFSPNVALRPVVEAATLPTICYVGGPAEVAYWAQLGGLFAFHGIDMPVVFPRLGATLLEGKIGKVLDKFDLDLDDFAAPAHELASRVAREQLPAEAAAALAALRRTIERGYADLESAATPIDPTLAGPIAAARNASLREVERAEVKILRQLKHRNAVALQQVEKARMNLYPADRPQERVLNPAQYLARYGPRFIAAVRSAFESRVNIGGDIARGPIGGLPVSSTRG